MEVAALGSDIAGLGRRGQGNGARSKLGSVTFDENRAGRDAGVLAQEVLQHLTLVPGAEVEVTLKIEAHFPEGAPDNVVRTVTENCRTLKFREAGFERG